MPATGRSTDVAPELGLDRDAPRDITFGAWFWDVENDGWLDLYVGGYGTEHVGLVAADYLGQNPERRAPARLSQRSEPAASSR